MKKFAFAAEFLVAFFVILIVVGCSVYKYNISPVSDSDELKKFEVEENDTLLSISSKLHDEHLIRSEFFYKLYVKLMNASKIDKGSYYLSENMGVDKIVKTLSSSDNASFDYIEITFVEGKNMRSIAKTIADNTNNSEDSVFELLKNKDYLDSLIDKYWFLTDEIKNDNIYYSLEGYLFPDTYQFSGKDVSVEKIFETMLDEFGKKIEPYKATIESYDLSLHQILTVASIVELEGVNKNDRGSVAGVFYNRLIAGWSLGSDVTTYYAIREDNMGSHDLLKTELNDCNYYNTRSSCSAGNLPVGPICNPGIESIEAAVKPTSHDYYYFVADKNKKTYFTKTSAEHEKQIKTLKDQGLWYEY